MKAEIVLILLSLVLVIKCERLTKDELTKSQEVIQSVPQNERVSFIAYTLGQGYMQANSHYFEKFPFPLLQRISKKLRNKFEKMPKPEYFDTNLYQFVADKYQLNTSQMFKLTLCKRLCFKHGKCVDLENIGELCCPF